MMKGSTRIGVTRRAVLEAGTAAAAVSLIGASQLARGADGSVSQSPLAPLTIEFTINGLYQTLTIDPRTTLLDALRERLGLTGTKKGCDQGQCGFCKGL